MTHSPLHPHNWRKMYMLGHQVSNPTSTSSKIYFHQCHIFIKKNNKDLMWLSVYIKLFPITTSNKLLPTLNLEQNKSTIIMFCWNKIKIHIRLAQMIWFLFQTLLVHIKTVILSKIITNTTFETCIIDYILPRLSNSITLINNILSLFS